jgi:trigger factor
MNVNMEKIENNVVKLEITVEADKFNEAMKKAFVKEILWRRSILRRHHKFLL